MFFLIKKDMVGHGHILKIEVKSKTEVESKDTKKK